MTDLRKAAEMALESLENLTTYDFKPSSIFKYFYPTAKGDYVDLREFKEKTKPAITALRQALARSEQVSIEPPDYVEPITFDYHEGWEEGFKAGVGSAKNKKESTSSNADSLLHGGDGNYIKQAQPEQEPVCDKDPYLCGFVQCQLGKACKNTLINTIPTKIFGPNLEQILNAAGFYKRQWVGLTEDEIRNGQAEGEARSFRSAVQWAETKLKERNT